MPGISTGLDASATTRPAWGQAGSGIGTPSYTTRILAPRIPASINRAATYLDTAIYSAAPAYFHSEKKPRFTGNATRRDTTRGATPAIAAHVWERASWTCTRSACFADAINARKVSARTSSLRRAASSNKGDPAHASSTASGSRSTRYSACHCPPRISRPLSTCNVRTLSPGTHETHLGVLQKVVQRRQVGDRQAFDAVQESEIYEVGAEERPGRLKNQATPGDFLSRVDQLRGRECCVAIHGLQVLRQRIAGKVEQVRIQMPDGAFRFDRFVNIIAHPFGLAAIVKPHLAVGIPA